MSPLEENVIRMAKAGIPRHAIAMETRASIETVYHYVAQARARGEDIPRGRPLYSPGYAVVAVPRETLKDLSIEAARRGLTAVELAQELLRVCARERLVAAVLDDGEMLE